MVRQDCVMCAYLQEVCNALEPTLLRLVDGNARGLDAAAPHADTAVAHPALGRYKEAAGVPLRAWPCVKEGLDHHNDHVLRRGYTTYVLLFASLQGGVLPKDGHV